MAGNPGWNSPTFPDTIGLPWAAARSGAKVIGSDAGSILWALRAQSTETIANLQTYVSGVTQAGKFLVEVFDAASFACGAVTTTVYRPSADFLNQGAPDWETDGGSTSNIYTKIDESTLNTTDYITYVGSGADRHRYAFNVASGAWPTDRRVKAIRVIWVSETQTNTMALRPFLRVGSTNYNIGAQVTLGTDVATLEATLGEINPATGLPWTQADVVAFASTTGVGFTPFNGSSTDFRIYQAWVEVDWVSENRLAVGEFVAAVGDSGWKGFALVDPSSGASNWAKVSGSDYAVLLRRVNSSAVNPGAGSLSVPFLDSGSAPPIAMSCFHPFVEGAGCLSSAGDVLTRLYPLVLNTTGPAVSLDSQPYGPGGGGGNAPLQPFPAEVKSGTDAEQEITTPGSATGSYTMIRFLVAPGPDATEPLLVKVKRRSDDVQFGSTITLTPGDALAAPITGRIDLSKGVGLSAVTPLHLVEAILTTPATLANSIQYYVEFSSTAGSLSDEHWYVAYLADASVGSDATFGGIVDQATANGSEHPSFDIPVTLSTQPDPPTNLNATLETVDLPQPTLGCLNGTVDRTLLTWTPTTLDADFDHYQIQRMTPQGQENTWTTIRTITDENITQVADRQAAIGLPTQYRIRVIRAGDLVPSIWSDTTETTRQGTGQDGVLLIASNLRPDLTYAYAVDPARDITPLNASNVTYRQLYGVDYSKRFAETEDRGDTFTVGLNLYMGRLPLQGTDGGRWAFDPAVTAMLANVVDWCVLDWTGRRWYAGIEIAKLHQDEITNDYTAELTATQLDGPTILDAVTQTFFLDTFDRGVNVLLEDSPVSDTGQVWGPFPPGFQFGQAIPAAIYDTGVGGLLGIASAVGGATYNIIDLGVVASNVAATVIYTSDTRGTSAGGILIGQAAMFNLGHIDNCLHMVLDPEGFIMQMFVNGTLVNVGVAIFDTPIPLDDVTESTFSVGGIGTDTIEVTLPRTASGQLTATFTDPRFSGLAGQYAIFESFWPDGPGYTVPLFQQVSATTGIPTLPT